VASILRCACRNQRRQRAEQRHTIKFPAAVLTRSFDFGAEMHILMKDIDLAIAQGEELGVPMWVCQAARLVFKHAMFRGAAKEDLTAIVKYLERAAGFELPKTR
jgi:3-hydroxyisobutyrate dehydrogenase-like beta-hydroxyacid dehydrogenase